MERLGQTFRFKRGNPVPAHIGRHRGPGVGYLTVLPLTLSSLAGGLL